MAAASRLHVAWTSPGDPDFDVNVASFTRDTALDERALQIYDESQKPKPKPAPAAQQSVKQPAQSQPTGKGEGKSKGTSHSRLWQPQWKKGKNWGKRW